MSRHDQFKNRGGQNKDKDGEGDWDNGTLRESLPYKRGGGGQGAEFGPPGPSKERDFTVCLQHQRGGWDGDGIGRFPKFVCQTGSGRDPGSVRGGKRVHRLRTDTQN